MQIQPSEIKIFKSIKPKGFEITAMYKDLKLIELYELVAKQMFDDDEALKRYFANKFKIAIDKKA